MKQSLFFRAIAKFLSGLALLGLLLFLPAGTWNWPNAWLLLGLLFVPMFAAGLVMLFRSPELLEKRLNVRETEPAQKRVILCSALMFLAAFLLAGLGRRFGWLPLPDWVTWAAAAVFLLSYALYAEVLRENVWLSRTVEVQENQKVVDAGLYGLVRHPMYSATVLLFLSMPLILGSLPGFVVTLCYLPIIVSRIRNEEKVLEAGLAGYPEYEKRVKYRLLPFIW